VLNKVGRKRCPRKVVGFPVAGPLGGARTPVRRNGTGPSRGKARGGYTSPIPAEIGWMRWVYLGRGPLVRPHRRKGFMGSPFSKGPSVRGVLATRAVHRAFGANLPLRLPHGRTELTAATRGGARLRFSN
jgi:hypothetical protein